MKNNMTLLALIALLSSGVACQVQGMKEGQQVPQQLDVQKERDKCQDKFAWVCEIYFDRKSGLYMYRALVDPRLSSQQGSSIEPVLQFNQYERTEETSAND
jgi:hypothetical protein